MDHMQIIPKKEKERKGKERKGKKRKMGSKHNASRKTKWKRKNVRIHVCIHQTRVSFECVAALIQFIFLLTGRRSDRAPPRGGRHRNAVGKVFLLILFHRDGRIRKNALNLDTWLENLNLHIASFQIQFLFELFHPEGAPRNSRSKWLPHLHSQHERISELMKECAIHPTNQSDQPERRMQINSTFRY